MGVREKLIGYSLNSLHREGGPKARGFERVLGITIEDLGYLEAAVQAGILSVPIASVRYNPPYGFNCVVDLPLSGIGAKSSRSASLRTVWRLSGPGAPPRLSTAFLKP
jgi:hypothetical protein